MNNLIKSILFVSIIFINTVEAKDNKDMRKGMANIEYFNIKMEKNGIKANARKSYSKLINKII